MIHLCSVVYRYGAEGVWCNFAISWRYQLTSQSFLSSTIYTNIVTSLYSFVTLAGMEGVACYIVHCANRGTALWSVPRWTTPSPSVSWSLPSSKKWIIHFEHIVAERPIAFPECLKRSDRKPSAPGLDVLVGTISPLIRSLLYSVGWLACQVSCKVVLQFACDVYAL